MANDNIAMRGAVYEIPEMANVAVRRELIYRTADAGPLTMDLHALPGGEPRAAVILVEGYSDVGFEKVFGSRFKDTGMIVSWAQLIAASGMTAITYTNREPAADLDALIDHLRANAASLGIDANRIGLWATSGNVPVALSAMMCAPGPKGPGLQQHRGAGPKGPGLQQHRGAGPSGPAVRCAALLYGFMLDLDGATGVADAAATFRFANPAAGRSLDDLPADLPMFIVRAGLDQFAGLNDAIDRFVAKALARNQPLTLVNHATGPHAFDLVDGSETSREVIRQALAFLRSRLA